MYTDQITPRINFTQLLAYERPDAAAWITGSAANPRLSGLVKFYQTSYGGVLVEAEIFGLPDTAQKRSGSFYAMHIHEHGDCSGNFQKAGSHFNPDGTDHPAHAGDMPPLLGSQGYAWSAFYDKRFTIEDILGRSVIIHAKRDDFTTQPSGASGAMIGCGEIRRLI